MTQGSERKFSKNDTEKMEIIVRSEWHETSLSNFYSKYK